MKQSSTPRPSAQSTTPMLVKRLFTRALLGSLFIAGLVGIGTLLSGDFNEVHGRILGTVLLIIGLSVGMLVYLPLVVTRYRWLSYIGMAAVAVACICGGILIWSDWSLFDSEMEQILKSYFFTTILSIAAAHACLMVKLTNHRVDTIRYGAYVTLTSIALLVGLFAYVIYGERVDNEIWRFIGVIGIISALGSIITPIWARIGTR